MVKEAYQNKKSHKEERELGSKNCSKVGEALRRYRMAGTFQGQEVQGAKNQSVRA